MMRTKPDPLDRETLSRDTGPQAILQLVEQHEMKQNDVAELLSISPATVSRRLREAREARLARQQVLLRAVISVILTVCALVCTAAWAWIAWG